MCHSISCVYQVESALNPSITPCITASRFSSHPGARWVRVIVGYALGLEDRYIIHHTSYNATVQVYSVQVHCLFSELVRHGLMAFPAPEQKIGYHHSPTSFITSAHCFFAYSICSFPFHIVHLDLSYPYPPLLVLLP